MGRDFNKSSVPPCSHWQQQAFKNVNGASLQRQWWALLAKIPRIKVLVSVFLVLWIEWRCICLVIDSEAFQKSKGGNKLELLCSIRVKTRQAYCVLRTNSKPWASGTHGITTKYWSKRTKRPGIRMSDFMKPILGTGRHRLFTFFMEGCFQGEISLFSPPPCLYPSNLSRSLLFYFSWSFLLCYTCACTWNTQSSAGIWVSHTEKGNPIIVSRCFWNEWICTVSSDLDSKADISMTSRHHPRAKARRAFHPSQHRGRGMTSPRIFESWGCCLVIIIAAAAFEERWSSESAYHLLVLPKGIHYVPSAVLCRLRNKQTPLTERAAKPTELRKSLCLPLPQLWVKPKASKHQFWLKTKKWCCQSLSLICATLQSQRSTN